MNTAALSIEEVIDDIQNFEGVSVRLKTDGRSQYFPSYSTYFKEPLSKKDKIVELEKRVTQYLAVCRC